MQAGARVSGRGASRVAEQTGLDLAVEEAVERALIRVLDSDMTDRLWERMLESDETQKLIERVAQAPELRAAIAYQGVGLFEDLAGHVADAARRIDDRIEGAARTVTRRPRRAAATDRAGALTRLLAFALDGAILNGILLGMYAVLGALASSAIAGDLELTGPAIAIGTTAWIIAGSAYLVVFWGAARQTPGMRFVGLRLETAAGRVGTRRAMRRLVGLVLAVLPFGLGLLSVLVDERRRGWHDRFAGTEVAYGKPFRGASTPPDHLEGRPTGHAATVS